MLSPEPNVSSNGTRCEVSPGRPEMVVRSQCFVRSKGANLVRHRQLDFPRFLHAVGPLKGLAYYMDFLSPLFFLTSYI